IKGHKKELVKIHKEKLKEEINGLKETLELKYEKYRELSRNEREIFLRIMTEKKDLFYQEYNAKASDFKKIFQDILGDLQNSSELLKNFADFKKIVTTLYKLDGYKKCYEYIEKNNKDYRSVIYNTTYNRDQLHKMKISHDTLLEYGLQIIENYDLLKQIIVDKYPYIFVDEYQDTDEKVIFIMSYLQRFSRTIAHNLFIGYFGDTTQNIYNNGVGKNITKIHSKLLGINKRFNRRSTEEVIEVINKIRNDGLEQVSIYEDCQGGSVKFYAGSRDAISSFIEKYEHQWGITLNNQMHCLVLTNETVAKYSGFENIYETFKRSKYYSLNYNQLNTELLSNDPSKLGEIPSLLFKIVKIKYSLDVGHTPVIDILQKKEIYEDMNFKELKELIEILKLNEGETLGEYIQSVFSRYSTDNRDKYKKVVDAIFENVSINLFKNYLIERLFPNISDYEIDKANEIVEQLFSISMHEYELWYKYISNMHTGNIIYHTYHGTKGLEFDNVIIIMENNFGRVRDYFSFFFENYMTSKTLEPENKEKYEQIKNLLYVSCSRARVNLRVLYIDDVSNLQVGIESIFGQIQLFNKDTHPIHS
ncbi:MAG: 3'-5' exonuclease, partial [Paenibacillus sp.]|uniref:UvrD-helicase domain-containing protein n=1 Tax=Paenibacillus sp. TaxID=58172 RepID=UPI00290B2B9F